MATKTKDDADEPRDENKGIDGKAASQSQQITDRLQKEQAAEAKRLTEDEKRTAEDKERADQSGRKTAK